MENEQNTQPAAAPAETPMPALDIVLASASPRRKQLLEDAGVRFVVHASEVDETLEPDLLADPPEACKKLAERKAGAVVQEVLAEDYTGMAAVIGADTMVVCEGEIFGKPVSLSDAKRMLRCLSGRTHEVLTAVSVWMVAAPEPENISLGFRTFVDRSAVTFRELTDEEIVDYLRKGESFDKAGAYAVQGAGADLVARVDGAMDTVIGLPVGRLLEEFPDFAGRLFFCCWCPGTWGVGRPAGGPTTRRWAAAPPDLSVESRARTSKCASPALSPRSRAPQPPSLTCCASLWHFQPIVPVPIAKCKNRDRQAGVTVSSPFPGKAMVH